ncbi:hypothetical protein CRG98_024137 [Punica granatum]|uniref:Uncharacterized protein n=1 Tax=Punica granatum TaxID=22663 RepID=A0A2I0JH02_PUNGR|nr:hypothetical protein CRG98_024137 [Punica granatum]
MCPGNPSQQPPAPPPTKQPRACSAGANNQNIVIGGSAVYCNACGNEEQLPPDSTFAPPLERREYGLLACNHKRKSKGDEGRPLHRGRRHPQRTSTTSVEGSGSPIGGPDPSSPFDFLLGPK